MSGAGGLRRVGVRHNRLCDLKDDDILYVLQHEDVVGVATELGIAKSELTPAVIRDVQRGIEAYMGSVWVDVIESGLRTALELEVKRV